MATIELEVKLNTTRMTKKWKKQQDKFIEIVERDTRQYVPAGTLALTKSAVINKTDNTITYAVPYARFMYHGLLVTDNADRVLVGKGEKKPKVHPERPLKYRKDVHPKATPYWLEIAKSQNLRKWIKELREEIKRG